MNQIKKADIYKWIGYVLLAFYGVSAIGFLYYCSKSEIFPISYLILMTAVLMIAGILFVAMHRKMITSIIASVLTMVLAAVCVLGSYYMIRTSYTISEVSKAEKQTDVVSVYVMDQDPAQSLEEIKGYKIGIIKETNRGLTVKQ